MLKQSHIPVKRSAGSPGRIAGATSAVIHYRGHLLTRRTPRPTQAPIEEDLSELRITLQTREDVRLTDIC